jgi:hypothetical protein
MTPRRKSMGRAYLVPGLLGVASLVGLVSALVGDGMFDAVSWLTLGGLVAVIAWAMSRRRA